MIDSVGYFSCEGPTIPTLTIECVIGRPCGASSISMSKDFLLLETTMGCSRVLGLVHDKGSIGIATNLEDSKLQRSRPLVIAEVL